MITKVSDTISVFSIETHVTAYLQLVVLRIMSCAAESIDGIASPFKAPEYRQLLSDARIDLSPRGSAKEMMAHERGHKPSSRPEAASACSARSTVTMLAVTMFLLALIYVISG